MDYKYKVDELQLLTNQLYTISQGLNASIDYVQSQISQLNPNESKATKSEIKVITDHLVEYQRCSNNIYKLHVIFKRFLNETNQLVRYNGGQFSYKPEVVGSKLNIISDHILNSHIKKNIINGTSRTYVSGVFDVNLSIDNRNIHNQNLIVQLNDTLSLIYTKLELSIERAVALNKKCFNLFQEGLLINQLLNEYELESKGAIDLKSSVNNYTSLASVISNTNEVELGYYFDRLKISQSQFNYRLGELITNDLLDNFLSNVNTQISLMGEQSFNSDPNRIKWLADNPQVKVGEFQSNLLPDELRMISEGLAYLIFWEDPDTKEIIFNTNLIDSLIEGKALYSESPQPNSIYDYSSNFLGRYMDSNLEFENIPNPYTGEKYWYQIDKKTGFEAVTLEVNNEIIVLLPGSEEFKQDWIANDIVPHMLRTTPKQYEQASVFVSEVKRYYPNKNIIVCGHSLAGGSALYAASENDVNAFSIDPAPSKEGKVNSEYNKGITIIPGGKSDGLLNEQTIGKDGYYNSNTDIDVVDVATGWNFGLSLESTIAQNNDNPSNNETVYLNSVSEQYDTDYVDDKEKVEYRDKYDGYFGNHMAGNIEDTAKYMYVPLGEEYGEV